MNIDKFQECWNLIDSIDKKHADKNTATWQIREIKIIEKKVRSLVDSFDSHDGSIAEYGKIKTILKKIEEDVESIDYLDIDTLKDRIHHIILSEYEPKKFKKNIYEDKPIEYFTTETFYETYFGHGVEADYKSTWRREYFFYRFLELHNPKIAEHFFSFLHDTSQHILNIKMYHYDIEQIIDLHDNGHLNEIQLRNYVQLANQSGKNIADHNFGEDKNTKIEDLQVTLRYIDCIHDYEKDQQQVWNNGYDVTAEEIYNSVNCNSGNCNIRVPVTKFEIESLKKGKLIKSRNCEHHNVYDENGRHLESNELRVWDDLPTEYPVIIRWLGVDKDKKSWFNDKEVPVYERAQKYFKTRNIKILLEQKETFIDGHLSEDKKTSTWTYNSFYLEFKSGLELEQFIEKFDDDFTSTCHAPELSSEEILKERRESNATS